MPVSKPLQIFGGGVSTPMVKKARQSMTEPRHAMNAALGIDNFSKLLQNSPGAADQINSQYSDTRNTPASAKLQQTVAANLNSTSAADMRSMGFNTNPADVQSFQAMNALQRALQQSTNPLAVVNSLNSAAGFRPQGLDAVMLGLRASSHKNRENSEAGKSAAEAGADKTGAAKNTEAEASKPTAGSAVGEAVKQIVGTLSAMFESGTRGIAAIGYDRAGGTSYGKYQIASKTGTMDEFIDFLQNEAPDLAKRLQTAGPANTGGRQGGMPAAWKAIAAEEPERFSALQQQFIGKSHYDPTMDNLSDQLGVNENDLSQTMREVVFSTAVQHGANGAGRIISRAISAIGLDRLQSTDPQVAAKAEQEVIRKIYDHRATQFTASTSEVRASVQARLKSEMNVALNMLKTDSQA